MRMMPIARAAKARIVGEANLVRKPTKKVIQAANWGPFVCGIMSACAYIPGKNGLYWLYYLYWLGCGASPAPPAFAVFVVVLDWPAVLDEAFDGASTSNSLSTFFLYHFLLNFSRCLSGGTG